MQKLIKSPETLLKYLVAGILIAVPLYPKFPFIRIPGTFVSVRLEDLLLILSFIFWLIFFFPGIKNFFKNDILRAIIIFLGVGVISLFSAIFVTQTITPHIGILHWFRRIEYFVPLVLGMTVIKKLAGNLNFFFKIILLIIFFVVCSFK